MRRELIQWTERGGANVGAAITAGLVLAATIAAPCAANAFVLDFAGLDPIGLEHPLNYYAGGFGSLGSGHGPNYGVTFSSGLYT